MKNVLVTKPSELAFYPVPKLFIKRVGGHEQWGAIHSAEIGDGTLECRDMLSLFCQFRRKVNGDVHFDSYFIVLPFWLEFLYQSDTSFRVYILRSDLRIIQKSKRVKGLFEIPTPLKLYLLEPLAAQGVQEFISTA